MQSNQAELALTPSELVFRLRGWAQADAPLYRSLAGAIGEAIEHGELLPGMRLPPERALASAITVGLTSAISAPATA